MPSRWMCAALILPGLLGRDARCDVEHVPPLVCQGSWAVTCALLVDVVDVRRFKSAIGLLDAVM